MVQVAVFDLDGTIIAGETPFILTRTVIFSRQMSFLNFLRISWWGIRYRLRLPIAERTPRELLFSSLTEPRVEEVDSYILDVFENKMRKRIRPDAIAAIEDCRAKGMKLMLISASFKPITTTVSDELHFDGQVSTVLEEKDDHYTGRVVGEPVQGEEKHRALCELCDERFGEGQWEFTCAFADHHSDIPLLSATETPIVVSPNGKLKRYARKHDWDIVEWD
ncbi:MAG: HAD family phosphatase [Coriobacteriaceae bacterium]|nr:HAD family phosphatase [Coriobacteriaceae bacterium]